uniref:Solute carrier family 4 member 1 adaptor protein n=1 Tax=Oryzias latipes TaxID=8090 RepID=A0A3P9HAW6_ORYLA
MAALSPPDASQQNTDEENQSAEKASESSATDNGSKSDKESPVTTDPETEDPFKRPAALTAPSITSKRVSVAAPTRAKAAETRSGSDKEALSDGVCENQTSEGGNETQLDDQNDSSKPKPESQAKVRPAKGPPAGKFPPIPYTEPLWGGSPSDTQYALEILKNGAIVDTVPLSHSSFFVVGRLPVCDVSLEHPSISRYHAVIQYRSQAGQESCVGEERGFYIHDLGSTHGTVVNKNKIPPKTYIRLRVGHVLKFGGSTRLFVLQGPEFDEEEESELTVTELKERAAKQKAELEKRMMGDFSDGEEEEEVGQSSTAEEKASKQDLGCTWGMDEEAAPEEDESEENPFSTEFHEDQEAAYLKDPKKALQGFFDREGEELEFEYEDKSHGSWLCRIKLPVDDALGRQLVAEATVTGKKKEAAVQCCLEACRMLEARGLLRQEAVSRKRKKKNWEDEDYYDSDDDTFLDRTGTVEKKRQKRMKKAGKVAERPETYESLIAKLSEVERELSETQKRLNAGKKNASASSGEDSLEAFMSAVRSEASMDAVERRKLHLHMADLRREAQNLRKLVDLTRPAQMPALLPSGSLDPEKPKKTLPLFGAMKGGRKLKLKTGTIGTLPPKRPILPAELFDMKALPPGVEEEEEEEEEQEADKNEEAEATTTPASEESSSKEDALLRKTKDQSREVSDQSQKTRRSGAADQQDVESSSEAAAPPKPASGAEGEPGPGAGPSPKKKRVMGPSRPPGSRSKDDPGVPLSGSYPEDDPDYSVWIPPAGQTGDGRTHLNDKYGY